MSTILLVLITLIISLCIGFVIGKHWNQLSQYKITHGGQATQLLTVAAKRKDNYVPVHGSLGNFPCGLFNSGYRSSLELYCWVSDAGRCFAKCGVHAEDYGAGNNWMAESNERIGSEKQRYHVYFGIDFKDDVVKGAYAGLVLTMFEQIGHAALYCYLRNLLGDITAVSNKHVNVPEYSLCAENGAECFTTVYPQMVDNEVLNKYIYAVNSTVVLLIDILHNVKDGLNIDAIVSCPGEDGEIVPFQSQNSSSADETVCKYITTWINFITDVVAIKQKYSEEVFVSLKEIDWNILLGIHAGALTPGVVIDKISASRLENKNFHVQQLYLLQNSYSEFFMYIVDNGLSRYAKSVVSMTNNGAVNAYGISMPSFACSMIPENVINGFAMLDQCTQLLDDSNQWMIVMDNLDTLCNNTGDCSEPVHVAILMQLTSKYVYIWTNVMESFTSESSAQLVMTFFNTLGRIQQCWDNLYRILEPARCYAIATVMGYEISLYDELWSALGDVWSCEWLHDGMISTCVRLEQMITLIKELVDHYPDNEEINDLNNDVGIVLSKSEALQNVSKMFSQSEEE